MKPNQFAIVGSEGKFIVVPYLAMYRPVSAHCAPMLLKYAVVLVYQTAPSVLRGRRLKLIRILIRHGPLLRIQPHTHKVDGIGLGIESRIGHKRGIWSKGSHHPAWRSRLHRRRQCDLADRLRSYAREAVRRVRPICEPSRLPRLRYRQEFQDWQIKQRLF